jgi:hypothetical protein
MHFNKLDELIAHRTWGSGRRYARAFEDSVFAQLPLVEAEGSSVNHPVSVAASNRLGRPQ